MKYKIVLYHYKDDGLPNNNITHWSFVVPEAFSFIKDIKSSYYDDVVTYIKSQQLFLRKNGYAWWTDSQNVFSPDSNSYFKNFTKIKNQFKQLKNRLNEELKSNNGQQTSLSKAFNNIIVKFSEEEINNLTENQLSRLLNQEIIKLMNT